MSNLIIFFHLKYIIYISATIYYRYIVPYEIENNLEVGDYTASFIWKYDRVLENRNLDEIVNIKL
jgi:hypothetical protein